MLEIASTIEADLIVLASHRPQMKDFLIGENAERVVRHARLSVMVVRD
ncbi:MAG: universal stress protein [Pseudomonadota bacterium]